MVREAADVARKLAADATLSGKRAELEAAQARAGAAEARAVEAEAAAVAAQVAADAVRPELQQIEAALNRLEGEAQTLSRVLNHGGASKWPAVVDQLKVSPGYETALGAALGDDLEASSDAGAPIHWAGAVDGSGDPALPAGVRPLSEVVSGSALLTRRLRQIGLVEAADAARLVAELQARPAAGEQGRRAVALGRVGCGGGCADGGGGAAGAAQPAGGT